MSQTLCRILLAVLLAATAFISAIEPATVARASEPGGSIMLILDGSGSMWGQVDNRVKIEIAHEVLIDLLEKLPETSRVGLVVYGHRVKGDCSDVQELVPLEPLNRGLLSTLISAIVPKGKTPITLALQLTAESLKDVEDEVTILLVSDGKETCEGDPCALVRALRESGVRVVVNVIGFDVTPEEGEQLRCIAEAGGGQYFSADTVDELQEAALSTLEDPRFASGRLMIRAVRNGRPVEVFVTVQDQETGETIRTDFAYADIPMKVSLQPGTYRLVAVDQGIAGEPEVLVENIVLDSGQELEQVVDFSSGELLVRTTKSGEPFGALIEIRDPASGAIVDQGVSDGPDRSFLFHLPSGTYDVQVSDTSSSVLQVQTVTVSIASGQSLEQVVDFGMGDLVVDVRQNGTPVKAAIWLLSPGTDRSVATGDSSTNGPLTLTVPGGAYDLRWRYYEHSNEVESGLLQNISVATGETATLEVAMEHGLLEVSCLKAGQPFDCDLTIYERDEQFSSYAGMHIRQGVNSIHLPAGEYWISGRDMEADGYPTKEVRGLVITPRTTTRADIAF